jgi:prophage tail gpP-like protein
MADILTLEINGTPYTGFKSAQANVTIEAASGSFSFITSALDQMDMFPIVNGSTCRVLANNIPIISGYVERIEIDYSAAPDHTIIIEGRDKTCDIIDSTLGEGMTFNTGTTIIDIANKVLQYLGIINIRAYTNASDIDPFGKGEIIASETGETGFIFIEKYAKKRQLLVTTDGDGNILFARTAKNPIKTVLNINSNTQPIIKDVKVHYDNSKRFYKYIVNTQTNLAGATTSLEEDDFEPEQVVHKSSVAYDEGARKSRIMNLMASEESYANTKDLQNRANYEANIRRARAFSYVVTVQGFTPINDPKTIWKPNLLVQVIDDYSGPLVKKLLVKEIDYSYEVKTGSICRITLVDPDSYSVDVIQGIKYKNKVKKEKQGNPRLFEL